MRDHLRETVLSIRDLLATAVPFAALALVLLALAYWWLDPAPPRAVVLATGQDQGAYAAFGKRYVELLKEDGIEVRLRKTAGAAENAALLRQPDGDVDIAFVQGGADDAQPVGGDESDVPDDGLGLARKPLLRAHLAVLPHRLGRAAAARARADEPAAARRLARQHRRARQRRAECDEAACFEANRIDPTTMTLVREAQTPSVVALLEGRDRRARVRVCARVAAGADAAADAGHSPVRFRPGRGVFAPLPVPQPGDLATRRGRPGARHSAGRRAPDRADGDAGGAQAHPSGAAPALRAGGAAGPRRRRLVPAARATSRIRATPSIRSPRRRSASTPAGRRCCSATCRSGSPT